ncbi:MAG: DHHW family protein [Clostridium sp.]|uniref:DHHW family protein n=1 Tax=Clostridium sp. TaxID=1506 RepID=UPI002FC63B91
MNRKQAIWMIIPFLGIVFGFTALMYIKPDYYESKSENRLLAQKPVKGKTGDKTYSEAYEKYVTDQFPLRDRMLKLHTKIEIEKNKTDINGYYLQGNGWIFEKSSLRLSEDDAKECSDKINEYAKVLRSRGKEVYYASTPQKENTLVNIMPAYSNLNILSRNTQMFLGGINRGNVNLINVSDDFKKNYNSEFLENMYFKTDNHWNGIGAYAGFKSIMNGMGVKVNDSDYMVESIEGKDFLGIYNQNLYSIYPEGENIEYVYRKGSGGREYYLHNGTDFQRVDKEKIIGTGIKGKEVTYSTAYTSSSIHYKTINRDAPIKKKLLIYRDSYHSAMSWLFEDMFYEVEVVDPRYISKSKTTSMDIAKTTDADIVLMMYNDFGFITMISEM